MEELKTKIEFKFESCERVSAYPVIVVAAGSSSRMRGKDKQLLSLGGVPVIIRTLVQLEKSRFISRIILVTRESELLRLQLLAGEYNISKLTDVVSGGSNRHESVCRGMERLGSNEKKVLIHDGARPLVDDFVIGNVASALETHRAVICGVPVADTVKRVDGGGNVIETVDRAGLYCVQTPQGVDVAAYRELCERLPDAAAFTDDGGLFEAAGEKVYAVLGSRKNIKITVPEDIEFARLLLGGEEE